MLFSEEAVCLFLKELCSFSLRDPNLSYCLTTARLLHLSSKLKCKSDCIHIKALKCNLALKARM